MPVYVDPLMNHGGSATFKWTHSCHLYANTVEELHRFAQSIGLKRAWFQVSRRGMPHYDLNAGRRIAAVKKGAIEHTARQAVEFWQVSGWMFRPGTAMAKEITDGSLFGDEDEAKAVPSDIHSNAGDSRDDSVPRPVVPAPLPTGHRRGGW